MLTENRRTRLTILHLSSVYPPQAIGGAEKVASVLAETQVHNGHRVFATSLVPHPVPAGLQGDVITRPLASRNPLWIADSARHSAPVRLANKVATIFNPLVSSEFAALLDDIQPDVLHTHSMVELTPAVWDQAARRSVPVVHTLHDYDLLCIRGALFKDGRACQPRHLACRALSLPKRALHKRIDAVAAVSRTVLDTHRKHGLFAHLPAERAGVIWNPLPARTDAVARMPRRAGMPLRIGYLGRVVEEKGLGVLIEACRSLAAQGWTLSIAGEGRDHQRFAALASGLPVSFEGYVSADQFLSKMDVVVSVPLWDEPFGLTTVEAYAAGCRVIGSDRGAIGELVTRIDPGWTVPSGDAGALAQALARAIEAGTALPEERKGAVDDLLAELQPSRVAAAYDELYQRARDAVLQRLSGRS